MKQTIELHKRWKDDPSKGEVFTPTELVREVLDKIPTSVWENPDSLFLDSCMGKGTFLVEIINRLVYIYGYSKEDAVSRVYGYDVCIKYVNYLKRGGLKNVFHKDFLNEEFNMKFDVVVGNPPYQENSEKGKSKGGGKNVMRGYALFVQKSMERLKENGNLFYIIPQGWQVSTHALWKLITSKYSLNYIDNNNQKLQEFFGNVGSTFCVINVKNEEYSGKTNVEGYGNINLKKVPTLSDSSNIELFEKTVNTFLTEGVNKLNFVGDSTFHYQKQTTKDNVSLQQDDEYVYPIKHTSSKTFYSKVEHPIQNTMKVIISDSGYLSPIFDNGEYGVTQHSPYMKVKSVEEGVKIVNFLNSEKIQELLKLTKKSGFYNINVINSLSYE
jgi:hypothetical protein